MSNSCMIWGRLLALLFFGSLAWFPNKVDAKYLRRMTTSNSSVTKVGSEGLDRTISTTTNGAAAGKVGLDFFFWGDWGHNVPAAESGTGKTFAQQAIAKQIGIFAGRIRPSFMCLLGDNFYDNGVDSTTDPLWEKYYRSVYVHPATFVPWYPVFGNHDYYKVHGKPQAQIDYWKKRVDNRWTFPNYQYTKKWPIPGTNKTLQIVFINAVALCPELRSGQIGWPTNPQAINNITQPVQAWINKTLAASTASYLIVIGHYNVYSNSEANNGVTGPEYACTSKRLVPLMQKYGVAAYLNGHMHNLQHHYLDGMNFITSGHGCDLSSGLNAGTPKGLLFNKTIGGFAHMRVGPNNMNLFFIDEDGKYIYNATLTNPSHRRRMALLAGQTRK